MKTIEYSYNIFSRYIKNKKTLELGPAEGVMTDLLVKNGHEITCVDGSEKFAEDIRKRHSGARVFCELFENFELNEVFDNIFLGHVLEHVIDPTLILQKCQSWTSAEGSMIFAAVPNALSIHRHAAVFMGLLPHEKAMSELDIHHGHRRIFDPFEFRQLFLSAGFEIVAHGGYWLKPLSNRQIEDSWTEEMLDAFMRLGERYPDIAAEQYIVAKLKN
jgi:2-polyprenyl-3-methyl-5-hydroxy-6-metoxy-1,4-benzoquinol methylase